MEAIIIETLKHKNIEAHILLTFRGMTSLYNIWKTLHLQENESEKGK